MHAFRWKVTPQLEGAAQFHLTLINQARYQFTDWEDTTDVLQKV